MPCSMRESESSEASKVKGEGEDVEEGDEQSQNIEE